jgi:DNA-binding NarL/FixJ family response regulator
MLTDITPREWTVLEMYVSLGSYKAVAHALGRSEQTIKNQMTNVRAKLDATNMVGVFTALGWLRVRKWEDEPVPAVTDTGAYWTVRHLP